MESDTRRQVIKNTSLVAVESVAAAVSPYLLLAFNLSKSMYGIGLQLRHQKALEWVEMIRDNPNIFTEEILQLESFQDGFVFALEQYIRERNEEKRIYYSNIFCNFTQTAKKEDFELERFYFTLTTLDVNSIKVLRQIRIQHDLDIVLNKPFQVKTSDVNGNVRQGIFTLISAGVLVFDTTMRFEGETTRMSFGLVQDNVSPKSPFLFMTDYGQRFVQFISYEK